MVPEKYDVDLSEELRNVLKWAEHNKLPVNMVKTKEIVFHRPNARNVLFPSVLPGIERVLCAQLLGVWLQVDMGMRKHVAYILHIGNQRKYLLTQLKSQGGPPTQLQNMFDAIILVRVLYASPAWRGYLSAANIDSLQQLFIKTKQWQIVTDKYDVAQLFDKGEMALFKSSLNANHCLRHLYPDKRHHLHSMTLRPRGHNFTLPKCRLQCTRNSFINRILFACL